MKNIRINESVYERSKAMLYIIMAILIGLIVGVFADSRTEAAALIDKTSIEDTHEMSAATGGSWHEVTRSYDLTVNTLLKYDNNAIINFNDTVAVGVYDKTGAISTTETESGFILSVIDDDSIKVSFYNHGTENIKPVSLTAEMSETDYADTTGAREYIINGYSACADGFGIVEMILSNDRVIKAVVFREDGRLYAANLVKDTSRAKNNVNFRKDMDVILANNNIRPDNSTYTDPVYYPIVPVAEGEKTDVDFWISKSNEIVESGWTDAHKVSALYEYIIDNLAYDYWVVRNTDANSRSFYHNDFKGTYFTSNTKVGVCEDFANILAIMCRAQGIPAIKIADSRHAWNYIYIADYNRWMSVDVTGDLRYSCNSKDSTEWTVQGGLKRYSSLDNAVGKSADMVCEVGIGNQSDMKKYNKI